MDCAMDSDLANEPWKAKTMALVASDNDMADSLISGDADSYTVDASRGSQSHHGNR